MTRIEPAIVPAVTDLARGLRELNVPFAVIGALVPELLLEARPSRMTQDADVVAVVQSHSDFETLKDNLERFGFSRTSVPYRMVHRSGGRVDILPYGDAIAPGDKLQLQSGHVLNMAGYDKVVDDAIPTKLDNGLILPVTPLPLYVLLKLVAYGDRREPKDVAGVFHCLKHYLEDNDRRIGLEHDGVRVPYDYTCAYLLGSDGQGYVDEPLGKAVGRVLDRFGDSEAAIIGIIARENGRHALEEEERVLIFANFDWYRRGLGL